MNLNKHLEFIQPASYGKSIHIIGVGAVGSRVAEMVVRLGFDNIHVYDFDIVEEVNVTNQLYTVPDIGLPKTEAIQRHLKEINPHVTLTLHGRYEEQPLNGIVFLSVDSIETRRTITKNNLKNLEIDLMIDMRMRLTDGQIYTARWISGLEAKTFLNSMQFDDKEDLTPVSVCGTSLSVAPTIWTLVSHAVMNMILFLKGIETKEVIFIDVMEFSIISLRHNK